MSALALHMKQVAKKKKASDAEDKRRSKQVDKAHRTEKLKKFGKKRIDQMRADKVGISG
jgi:hypothetical protein